MPRARAVINSQDGSLGISQNFAKGVRGRECFSVRSVGLMGVSWCYGFAYVDLISHSVYVEVLEVEVARRRL